MSHALQHSEGPNRLVKQAEPGSDFSGPDTALTARAQLSPAELKEFEYKPVPVLAPVSLFLGICSVIAMFSVAGALLCVIGLAVSFAGLWQIRRANGEYGGRVLARVGFVLSGLFLVSGIGWHSYLFATEVPEGYQRVSFSQDISRKGCVVKDGVPDFNSDVAGLDGQHVFVKGYMYQTRQTDGLKKFLLLKDNQQCCFGGQPSQNDMIEVEMQGDKTAEYHHLTLVSVGGVFRLKDIRQAAGQAPVYKLEATHFGRAKTSF